MVLKCDFSKLLSGMFVGVRDTLTQSYVKGRKQSCSLAMLGVKVTQ